MKHIFRNLTAATIIPFISLTALEVVFRPASLYAAENSPPEKEYLKVFRLIPGLSKMLDTPVNSLDPDTQGTLFVKTGEPTIIGPILRVSVEELLFATRLRPEEDIFLYNNRGDRIFDISRKDLKEKNQTVLDALQQAGFEKIRVILCMNHLTIISFDYNKAEKAAAIMFNAALFSQPPREFGSIISDVMEAYKFQTDKVVEPPLKRPLKTGSLFLRAHYY